jgi:transposase
VYGAVDQRDGENFFLIMPYCNTDCMNVFLHELSKAYADDEILLVCDGAMWHRSGSLMIPTNIHIIHIPPYTPEMNPIEQIWKEIRKRRFRNEVFKTLEHVVERLYETIKNLPISVIQSITGRQWILDIV